MVGSVPLSVSEVTMAPAIIASLIKNRGHNFEFLDLNLELYDHMGDKSKYHNAVENFNNWNFKIDDDDQIEDWFEQSIKTILKHDVCIINVFSVESQFIAYWIAKKLENSPISIFMGGVGSHKNLRGSATSGVIKWAKENFTDRSDFTFGKLLLNNKLINHWQSDVSTTALEKHVPDIGTTVKSVEFDFSIYDLDRYYWDNEKSLPLLGSYGCVRQCEFCDVLKHFGKYQFVEADKLSKSIIHAYQTTGVSKFNFMDSLVNGSMSNFENLLKNLVHSKEQNWLPKDFSWSGTYIIRQPSILLDRIHNLLPLSGLDTLVIGVETGSDRVRFDMQKKFTNNDLISELESFYHHRVKAMLLFFTGWPTETETDFFETVQLFHKLRKYGQVGTIDSVAFSTHGFSLIDGTPIDNRKNEIGLEAGPLPNLWKCKTNPDLDLYQILRRRLIAVETAKYFGINIGNDTEYRRQALYRLQQQKDSILDYFGPLKDDKIMDVHPVLSTLDNKHKLLFEFSNSGTDPVEITLSDNCYKKTVTCYPGMTEVKWQFEKSYYDICNFSIRFKFVDQYTPVLDKYTGGDYYSRNGVYINKVQVDYNDITLNSFNNMTSTQLQKNIALPKDFYQNFNTRNIIHNTCLSWTIPAKKGIHSYLWEVDNCESAKEQEKIDKRITEILHSFVQV